MPLKTIHNYVIFHDSLNLPRKEEYFFSDLAGQKLILLHPKLVPFENKDEIRAQFSAHGLEHFDILCENDRTGIFLAECGYGVCIVPEFRIPDTVQGVNMYPFEQRRCTFEYGMAFSKDMRKAGLQFLAEHLHL